MTKQYDRVMGRGLHSDTLNPDISGNNFFRTLISRESVMDIT
jgi:hypothetical protein